MEVATTSLSEANMGIKESFLRQYIEAHNDIWHVFDLETGRPPMALIEPRFSGFAPKEFATKELSVGNLKDAEKIEAKRQATEQSEKQRKTEFEQSERERFEKFKADTIEKSSLTDDAPIICLSFQTGNKDKDKAVFSAMPRIESTSLINGFELYQFDSEREMLTAYAAYLQGEYGASEERFILSGFNILGFDLPLLRARMNRNGVAIPAVLLPKAERVSVYDQMKYAPDFGLELRRYAERNGWFVPFHLLAKSLGIDSHKEVMTGSEVPKNHLRALELIEDGKPDEAESLICEILIYSALDAQKETAAYLKMTGRY
jgi:hypothetical protein